MFAKLIGLIDEINEDSIILNVNDVGYLVFCSSKTLNNLENNKNKMSFFIETIVREDSINLFGFLEKLEQKSFNVLCTVNGVGPKMALRILGIANYEEIVSGILNKEKSIFTKASGVGEKLAMRIITELANSNFVKNCENIKIMKNLKQEDLNDDAKILVADSVKALESLGYQKNTVYNMIINLLKEKPYLTLESVITESLKLLNKFK